MAKIALLPSVESSATKGIVPGPVAAALERVEGRGIIVERCEAENAPSSRELASSCDVLLLDGAGRAPWLRELRASPDAGTLPVAVWGERDVGIESLACGADLWLDPARDGEILALELAALVRRAQLGGAPRLDSLTGLIGRRWLRELLHHEFERSRRYRRSLGLLVIEPDPIEQIERELGLDAGDRTLRELAAVLRTLVRDVDLLGRLSGARFAVILPETDAAGALAAAERLREAVEQTEHPSLPRPEGNRAEALRLPVSIGLCAFPARGISRTEDLLGRALESLSQAKQRGGNAVVAFGASNVIWSRDAPDPAQYA